MARESLKDNAETYRSAYSTAYQIGLNVRRYLHIYFWTLAAFMVLLPQYPILWTLLTIVTAIIGTNRNIRDESGFGRGRGPYLKPVSNAKKMFVDEEWHIIDAPPDKGGDGDWAFGNNRFTMEEVYANDDKARRHILLFGTTGSGKTVSLMGLMYQAIVSGSGLIFVDGKSDPKTWFELYACAALCGRVEDLLVLNFVVGATADVEFAFDLNEEREEWEEFRAIESNTYNLFGTGTADTLFELGTALLGNEGGGGDNKMWQDRAEALLRTLMKALCALRDEGWIQTSVQALRDHMVLEKLEALEKDDRVPEFARDQIKGYLDELPGFRDAAKEKDPGKRVQLMEQPNKQHGFLTMQFTGLFAMLTGTYAHVCDVTYSDINFPDVVYNRRILMVMLPALEKSPSSLSSLGRMAVAGIKSALSQAISGRLSGSKKSIVDRRPTNAPRALLCIMDEYGSYAVEGFGDVVAQARSLGVSAIFAGQEYAGFKKAGDNEAQRILSNTGIKIFLKNEDWETADVASKRLGEIEVLKTTGKTTNQQGREINSDPSYQSVARLSVSDLSNLSEGQGILIYNNFYVPIAMPYVKIPETKNAQRMDMVPLPGSIFPDRAKARSDRLEIIKEMEQSSLPINVIEFLDRQRKKAAEAEQREPIELATTLMTEYIQGEVMISRQNLDSRAIVQPFTGHDLPGIIKCAMPDKDQENEEFKNPLVRADKAELNMPIQSPPGSKDGKTKAGVDDESDQSGASGDSDETDLPPKAIPSSEAESEPQDSESGLFDEHIDHAEPSNQTTPSESASSKTTATDNESLGEEDDDESSAVDMYQERDEQGSQTGSTDQPSHVKVEEPLIPPPIDGGFDPFAGKAEPITDHEAQRHSDIASLAEDMEEGMASIENSPKVNREGQGVWDFVEDESPLQKANMAADSLLSSIVSRQSPPHVAEFKTQNNNDGDSKAAQPAPFNISVKPSDGRKRRGRTDYKLNLGHKKTQEDDSEGSREASSVTSQTRVAQPPPTPITSTISADGHEARPVVMPFADSTSDDALSASNAFDPDDSMKKVNPFTDPSPVTTEDQLPRPTESDTDSDDGDDSGGAAVTDLIW
ncbi:MAG: type IV secretion system DNA-binding domain-containing protein [Marinospirillum sp.]|uniref:type IV secretion system DNA-binding domain-containing protein n=1 Tax=Marinospirillum sp. TaxID=2183934 RepID=UPI0019F66B08|nr:type IV secretion system DNA-binding domain-containing protein [Marinospirillum sp.]MBE0506072.1 type IV secretion system DNA-binding domain-containing protein [Marinospirillum sp.]